ncbi:serine hydrolase domain-containing protein [Paracoccus benzoatiresistens]|uniref:Serine hydrolase n=1 Tax=Paracoccus benzoatiresistens TaxID=2997341 RepID=A0ABT4JAM3_9RHOB|nr:serine hydrolase domain-containing protein [Paracoccus sp. EF6]MCZ0963969.1 serine hydrolase [Paracoccus sp. EF6]
MKIAANRAIAAPKEPFRPLAPILVLAALAPDQANADEAMAARVRALTPELEAYVAKGMSDFDLPGLAMGIVVGDDLVYAKGFGLRRKDGEPVDPETVFQIGSTTKAFLATTLAIAVDRKKLDWDDRVVDYDPDFQMKDPWVTSEFRVADMLAQRSGLPPYANDAVGLLGFDQTAMIRSLRHVEPVSSFRSTFAYTNITHMLAQRVVARAMGEAEWDDVVRAEIFAPLGMTDSSFTADAIEAAADTTAGYLWTAEGTAEVPFTPIFPYGFGAAGAINSTVEDMAKWLRLHLGDGAFEGRRIVSEASLAVTKTPRVAISDRLSYAMGWVVQSTPNGRIIWHNGGTTAFGAFVGTAPDHDLGIVVLTNETNVGLPDAIGEWTFDRLMGNPRVDHVAARLTAARKSDADSDATFAAPAAPRPGPPLAPLAASFDSPVFGEAAVTAGDDGLVLALKETGARLKLAPWNGDVFTASLVPEGRFAAVAANLGPLPMGFAQFQADETGKLATLRLTMSDGQVYDFARQ